MSAKRQPMIPVEEQRSNSMTVSEADCSSVSNRTVVDFLRQIHGNKLIKYKDHELIKFYNSYTQSEMYKGIGSNNFLYFVW